jgi:foldase protein PrsA
MKKFLAISICSSLLLLTGCGKIPTTKDGDELVSKIKNKNITVTQLYESLKDIYGVNILMEIIDKTILDDKYPTNDEILKEVEDYVKYFKTQTGDQFLDYIKYYGYGNTEEEFRNTVLYDTKKNKVINAYAKKTITDKEIEDYYKNETVGDIKASHILIAPKTTDKMTDEEKTKAEEDAKTLAKEIITKLNNGEKFADLAKKYSTDEATANKGGDLGYFNKGTMDAAFESAAYALEKNKYTTEPVKSAYGYHIILKTGEKEKVALDKIKDDIIEKIASNKITNDKTIQYTAIIELRKEYGLEIYDDELKAEYEKQNKTLLDNANKTNDNTTQQ